MAKGRNRITSFRVMIAMGVALALLSVSSAALFIRFASAPPLAISFWRCFAGALFFSTLAAFRRLKSRNCSSSSSKVFSTSSFVGAVLAGFFLAAHFATWITSLFYTPVAVSVVLVCTQPLFVTLFSVLWLKERTSFFAVFGMFVAFAGSMGIALQAEAGVRIEGMTSWRGPVLALLGAVFVAGYMLFSRKLRSEGVALVPFAALVYASAAFVLGGAALVFGQELSGA
ncbi:MAG: DMT family transporter [Deltaproteobacteria bacterium]|nr:DMT family transporter [Deltaproteobacteria bacterium]